MSGGWELHEAIYSALTSDSVLMSSVKGVYDFVPQAAKSESNDEFPFVTIGDDDIEEWDTDTEIGSDAVVRVHVWSRWRGRRQAKELQQRIYQILHRATISISGYHLVGIDFDSLVPPEKDPDGLTYHGVQLFRVTFEESTS